MELEDQLSDSNSIRLEKKGRGLIGGAGMLLLTGAVYFILNVLNPSTAYAQKKNHYTVKPCAKDYKELLIFAKDLHWDANLVDEDGLVKSIYTTDSDVNLFGFVDIKEGKNNLGEKIIKGDYEIITRNGVDYMLPEGSSHYVRLIGNNRLDLLNKLIAENGQVDPEILEDSGNKIGLFTFAVYDGNFNLVNSSKMNLVIFEKGGALEENMDDYLGASKILEGLINDYKLKEGDKTSLTIKLTTVLSYLSNYISDLNGTIKDKDNRIKELEGALEDFNKELSNYLDPSELRIDVSVGLSNDFTQSQEYDVGNERRTDVISGEPTKYDVKTFMKLGENLYLDLKYSHTHGDINMNNDPNVIIGLTRDGISGSIAYVLYNGGDFKFGINGQADYEGATLRVIEDKETTGGSDERTQYGLGARIIKDISGTKIMIGANATKSEKMGEGYNVTFQIYDLTFGDGKFKIESDGTFGHRENDLQNQDYANFNIQGIYFITPPVGILLGYDFNKIEDNHNKTGFNAIGNINQVKVGIQIDLGNVLGGK